MILTHYTGSMWKLAADHCAEDFIFIRYQNGVYSFSENMMRRIPPPCSTVMGEAWEEACRAHSTVPTLGIAVQGVAIDTNLLPIKPLDI